MDGDKQPVKSAFSPTALAILGKIGCLTFIIAGAALFGGLWLDGYLGTRPWLTVVLVGLSVPAVMALTIKITLAGTKHLAATTPANKLNTQDLKEENDSEPGTKA
jgi:hypothetical protein